ncbi:MAG: carbohydrate porin [Roseomonas sp.]|nr:carbohydrate porin [Roseomonas sp.]MCA3326117.1 carbohydrate porin [Roseomonas sp.]MCA3330458.1 carbohydrate porin [Roseomonas sp.]MCA3335091.1 carbohydrate porin [Roseomonas sp.]MCA3346922.1 carbohydrate porin [Roseomonas sp.]
MPIRTLIHFGFGFVLLFSSVGVALADMPEYRADGLPEPSIATSLPANGDPFGHRAALAAQGVNFNLWYRNDTLGNLAGGQRRGFVNQGLFEPSLSIDFGELAGLDGLSFYSNLFVIHNTGRMRRDYVGGVNTIAAIEAVPTLRLSELWLEQKFLDDRMSLRAGVLAADVEFFFSAASTLFLQSDFATISALNLPSGGPAYPLATPGIRFAVNPVRDATWRIAVYNGDPAGPGAGDEQVRNHNGTNFRVRDPALIFSEAELRANRGDQDQGLARTLKLGGWAHLGGFDDMRRTDDGSRLADPASSGVPLRRRGNGGLYAVLDQQLFRPAGGGADSGATLFLRGSVSPSDRSTIGQYLDGGVVFAGLVADRPEDRFGFGLIYARFSDGVRDYDRDRLSFPGGTGHVRDYELNLELTYQARILPGFDLQPVLTRIWHAGGEPGRNALVAGIRAHIRF